MKKIVLGVLLVVTSTTYAQKDELKTLKKLYDKEQLSADDFSKYKETVLKLESVATTENDKIAAGFYKAMQPLAELSTMGGKPNPMMIQKLFTPEIFTIMAEGMRKTLDFESKLEKKVFTEDINKTIDIFKPIFKQMAFAFNGSKKYKEASRVFYNTYQLDPNDVSNLENAAITAMQAEEYIDAEKYYREIKTVGFSGTGLKKFASKPEEVAKSIFALSFFNKKKILIAGNIFYKNIQTSLEVLKKLNQQRNDIIFIQIGSNNEISGEKYCNFGDKITSRLSCVAIGSSWTYTYSFCNLLKPHLRLHVRVHCNEFLLEAIHLKHLQYHRY